MFGFGNMLKDYLDYYKISQTEFADRLNISQKHMNEIINGKTNISNDLILAISLLTNIDANLIYYVENKKRVNDYLKNKFKSDKELKEYLNGFSLKEMNEKKWLKLKDKNSLVQNYIDLIEYMNVKDIDTLNSYLEKRFLFKKNDNANNTKIYLWIRHCDIMTSNIEIDEYNPNKLSLLFEELKNEQNKKFNKKNLIDLFKKYGIILYIEDALKGSKVRGCIRVKINTPVIYMTTYYKEKSSFYFTLYHELIHLKKDYNKLKNKTIIEDDNSENDIDSLALSEMIPEDVYEEIINNYENREIIAKRNNIPLCFLYSRLAKENKIGYKSKEYINNREKID
ncbi:MAG: helix-turn-helix domain-containing protein [Bacilli bacterium]|nr:helix-turn-helix domain-containing protein [Bacilli bacterium]MBO6195530.1 helix-turn-helix domain-containing protein [Bacilli bacterium]